MMGISEWEGFNTDTYLRLLKHIEDRMENYPEGGTREEKEQFFSDLDDSYQEEWIVDALLDRLYHKRVILTGGFGRMVARRIKERKLKIDYILYNGGLRSGAKPEIQDSLTHGRILQEEWSIGDWWLVDDSYYSGRTKMVLEMHLMTWQDYGLTNTVCVYDGSNTWNPQVHGMYKWYMIHGLEMIT